jgi:cyanophycinase-like exopeptidase
MRGTAYLVGSGQDGLLPKVAKRARDATAKAKPRVAVTYAPVAGSKEGLAFMSERMPRLFPDATLARFAVRGEEGATDAKRARAVVESADLVFVSGGDPTLGAKILVDAGADAWLREARDRGTPVMGVSAGSIVLGAWWAEWPDDDEDDDADLARTKLVACTGVVPGVTFDTHNEADDWDELRVVSRLASKARTKSRFLGIPTGGALVFDARDRMEVVGKEPFVLKR